MNTWAVLFPMLKADFLERTRRSSFLVTICLVIYLGYAVNTGQILITLDRYRGVFNSAWVGSMMALVITFFLGVAGFFLVKNTIERDEQSGVGQIIATTPLTRPQYLLGKWLSNFALLSTLVTILAFSALLMQILQREAAQIQIGSLVAPFLFIALPMMALLAALAVFFETVSWLKGGFGNLVYLCLFIFLFTAAIFLTNAPWLDVSGVSIVSSDMKTAAKAAFPDYNGDFTLSMISEKPLQSFVWPGLDWTVGLILQRLMWVPVSIGIVLSGAFFFNRFDPARRILSKRNRKLAENIKPQEQEDVKILEMKVVPYQPLLEHKHFHANIFQLIWLECLLLVKGLKWYWYAGSAILWIGSAAAPSESIRSLWFVLCSIWPVLIWSRMGVREARYQTRQLVYQSAGAMPRMLVSSWLAGVCP